MMIVIYLVCVTEYKMIVFSDVTYTKLFSVAGSSQAVVNHCVCVLLQLPAPEDPRPKKSAPAAKGKPAAKKAPAKGKK